MAAVAAGIRHVQATINGYGERCGNANMVTILANLALKTPHALVPAGGGDLAGLTELSRSVAEIANVRRRTTTSRTSAARRSPTRAASTARPSPRSSGATSTSTRRRSATPAGSSSRSSAAGRTPRSAREQLGHELEGVVDPRELSKLIKQLETEGLAFEGAEASFELLIRRHAADYAAPFRIVDYTVPRRAARRPRAAGRGDRQGRGRRRGAPHRGRRQRPGQRPRRRAAQGAQRVLPGHRRGPPRRLQGAHPRRRRGDGRPDPGHHRLAGRRPDLVDDGQRHEHHRGLGVGARRLARVRDLEVRRRAAAPRRAPLHDATAETPRRRAGRPATRPRPRR